MKKIVIKESWIPLVLLGICLVSFGIFLPQLGFYWDDWMTLYLTYTYRDPSALVYQAFRPIHAWLDVVTLSLIGTKPIYWHMLSLLFRWLASWGVWEVLRRIWSERNEEVAWIAILFTVYPTFFQQSVAVIFRPHWFTFVFYLLSIICMLTGYRKKKFYWPVTLLGVFATITHLFNSEYLTGLELARPAILLLIITEDYIGWKERIKQVLKHWAPYLIVFVVFTFWRFFFVQIENDPSSLLSISEIFTDLSTLINLVIISIRDMLYMLVTSWYQTLQPDLIKAEHPSDLLAWAITFLTFIILLFVMRATKFQSTTDGEDGWAHRALVFGLFTTFVALVPVWVTGRKVIVGMWSDRLSVPAMFGASIFIVAVISMIISRRNYRFILLSMLVGLAVAAQFRTGNDFRWDWIRQKRTYWQMYWRAPAIEPNTPIIADGALTGFVSRYTAAFAINMLYPQDETNDLPTYWYFEVYYNKLVNRIPAVIEGANLKGKFYSVNFMGDSNNSILIFTPSGENRCVWFLTPEDVNNGELPLDVRQLAEASNADRILPEPISDEYPIMDIFGPEPEHTWCYYYQKANLAHQMSDWEQVIKLMEEAEKMGFKTKNGYELIPFIESNAALGQWDQAVELTNKAFDLTKNTDAMLCAIWERFNQDYGGDQDYDLAQVAAMKILICP
jgi:hypothetical protein